MRIGPLPCWLPFATTPCAIRAGLSWLWRRWIDLQNRWRGWGWETWKAAYCALAEAIPMSEQQPHVQPLRIAIAWKERFRRADRGRDPGRASVTVASLSRKY